MSESVDLRAGFKGEGVDESVVQDALTVKRKRFSISLLVSILLSLIGAIALWLYVVAGNNTVEAVSVTVFGNERLMGSNYSVSDVSPKSVDIVLRGKSEEIKQILNDKSLISLRVNIFKSSQVLEDGDCFIFENESKIKPGEYTVDLEAILPEGVTCASKSVKVSISESSSKTFDASQIRHSISNYSFAADCSLGSIFFEQNSLTVSGDVKTVNSIASVSVISNWSKEISGDVTINGLVPVAYDKEGDEIDSRFLRFEPEMLQLNISVTKKKTLSFYVTPPVNDTMVYTLSPSEVTVSGPVKLIEKLNGSYCLNDEQTADPIGSMFTVTTEQIAKSVEGGAAFANELHFVSIDGKVYDELAVRVSRNEGKKIEYLTIPASMWNVLTAEGMDYEILTQPYTVELTYVDNGYGVPSLQNLLCFVDLRGRAEGEYVVSPKVALIGTSGFKDLQIVRAPMLDVRLTRRTVEPGDTTEPTVTPTAGEE